LIRREGAQRTGYVSLAATVNMAGSGKKDSLVNIG